MTDLERIVRSAENIEILAKHQVRILHTLKTTLKLLNELTGRIEVLENTVSIGYPLPEEVGA